MRSMIAILVFTLAAAAAPAAADSLDSLAKDFWTWRAAEQPASGDDIPRLDRARQLGAGGVEGGP